MKSPNLPTMATCWRPPPLVGQRSQLARQQLIQQAHVAQWVIADQPLAKQWAPQVRLDVWLVIWHEAVPVHMRHIEVSVALSRAARGFVRQEGLDPSCTSLIIVFQ